MAGSNTHTVEHSALIVVEAKNQINTDGLLWDCITVEQQTMV